MRLCNSQVTRLAVLGLCCAAATAQTLSVCGSVATLTQNATISVGSSITIVTQDGAAYLPLASCLLTLTVNAPAGWMVRLRPVNIMTEAGYDILSVYSGPNTSMPLAMQLSGTLSAAIPALYTEVNVTAISGSILLRFVSDGGLQYAGVRLTADLVPPLSPGIVLMCPTTGGTKTSTVVISPAQSLLVTTNLVAEYAPLVTCNLNLLLDAPIGWTIRMRPASVNCNDDSLTFYDGANATSQIAAVWTGASIATLYKDVNATQRAIFLKFISDGATQNSGVQLLVEAVPPLPAGQILMCPSYPGTSRRSTATIVPGIPCLVMTNIVAEYAPSINCGLTLLLDAPPGWMLRLRPVRVDSEGGYDIMSVYDGANTSMPLALQVSSNTESHRNWRPPSRQC